MLVAAALMAWGVPGAAQAPELPSWRGPDIDHQRQLIREAESFIDDYTDRLRAGDRAGLPAFYDPDGAILVLDGRRMTLDRAQIEQLYADQGWRPPASLEWPVRHYEAVGADAVVVLGDIIWVGEDGRRGHIAYHALLRREDGRLYIRIENETFRPETE